MKISIIIPVYNGKKYLSRCLESILNQTYKDFEIIAINDGSTDESEQILKEYASKYPQIIKHKEQTNSGIAVTRNNGLKMAEGEYVTFIDDDDFLDADYLETYMGYAQEYNLDVVVGGFKRPNSTGKIMKKVELPIKSNKAEWAKFRYLTPWAKIYKTSYIKENKIEFLDNNVGEDTYFELQALQLTDKIKVIDYTGYNWFYNEKSISNTIHKDIRQVDFYRLLNECYNVLKQRNILEKNYSYMEAYFFIFSNWFLMYSTKRMPYKYICEEYNKLNLWLQEHFPDFKKNKYIGIGKLKGEGVVNQIAYFIMKSGYKLHFSKQLIWLYSKM